MTERGRRHVRRDARSFAVGPSRLEWDGHALSIEVDERCSPWPHPVLGNVRVHPLGLCTFAAALDGAGRHRWGPIAPCARIEVDLPLPGLRWQGNAYLDSNEGDEPIERGFVRWDWLRAPLPDGRCAVLYDVQPRDGGPRTIGARFGTDGSAQPLDPAPGQRLPRTRWWRMDRRAPIDASSTAVQRTLEDTPFYARSLLRMPLGGALVDAVHETLDVSRLTSPIVQRLLPWRMPRVA
jgi:carotenoid 1,2-hydratase